MIFENILGSHPKVMDDLPLTGIIAPIKRSDLHYMPRNKSHPQWWLPLGLFRTLEPSSQGLESYFQYTCQVQIGQRR